MKMTPELKKAQHNMQPGEITANGFLGDDDRSLVDIIEEDEEKMLKLNLEFEKVSEMMKELLEKGRKGFGEPIKYLNWEIKVDEARGFLACPFEDGIFRKINVILTNNNLNETIIYTDLSVHLLEKHHFLQGKGSDFRLSPNKLKRVLEL
ncbi:hypothetical protein OF820_00935 [Oceanotoga sp. DSM 15011]|jgi:hypothetical protein|uniref:Uncharacterized protein n=1 Tax=Oceanotoga teriensis TaxID=515440 RepID=A0AA45C943_9BACT|nr:MULTISPECIES: hypothetical protein [Oceanotoga]MDN5341632.1 hypothetical protein [Oceanotoga sp.]MDO7977165.1 hypothetical protein [Oceanotoga teriensis]PWJ96564.1 hypothetical protein C7380_101137 [Oceanotoga teriensis]UYP00262.1 hypothetical protein OF820_00935 [Oceanotoga sp. DSM 15011]